MGLERTGKRGILHLGVILGSGGSWKGAFLHLRVISGPGEALEALTWVELEKGYFTLNSDFWAYVYFFNRVEL